MRHGEGGCLQHGLVFEWAAAGKTSIGARLGHPRRRRADAPARDFSGAVGGATVNWAATGKTKVVTGPLRNLSSCGLDVRGHVRSPRFFIGPVWSVTAHTTVTARYDRTVRSWRDVGEGTPQTGRRDVIQAGSVGVDWTPRPIVTVSAFVRGEKVKSTLSGGKLSQHRAGPGPEDRDLNGG